MDQYKSNQPNAAKLISSLRNTGYDSYAAVEDIIDNAIDAQARVIKIVIESHAKELKITIADNGTGMNEAILEEALKLGSLTNKDEVSDLGKFGMGLCTASISLAKKLEVITRERDSTCLYSSQDLDEIARRNEFVKILRPADDLQTKLLESLSGKQGTVVILTNIDRLSDTNISQFANKLSKDMGRIYRKFIEAGIEFFINDKKIDIHDPLMIDHPETKIYSDEIYDLPANAVNNKKEKIRIRIAILPEVNTELAKEMKMNIRNQGFYVLRNNREVGAGETLDIFSKHNDFNRLRMELYFSATLDNEMGVRFSKDGVKPNQVITDFLKNEIGGQIRSIRGVMLKNKKTSEGMGIDHTGSEEVIAQKAKLLITPEAHIEKRSSRVEGKPRDEDSEPEEKRDRVNFRETKTSPKGLGARFETASMGRESILYDTYQEGKVIVIRWNSDHPFYDRIILANKDSKELISGLDYLIFALASAELKNSNDDNVELMANIKAVMSANLRALLS